jgi:fatty-acyl-CoA synthase
VVRFDIEAEQPVRDARGFCIRCEADEVGEMIGKILNDPSKPSNRFEGYASEADTDKKVLRNVFETGDAWFRTGDLMRRDENGYFYFVDRVGDTFRWKGENVATSEVSEAITTFPGINEANVYGVGIAGQEGRAGMAALVVAGDLDLGALRAHLVGHLPEFARPLFLRIKSEIEVTGTFKQKKVDLVRQGFNPTSTRDPIYFNDAASQSFVRLDEDLYERIQAGEVRL